MSTIPPQALAARCDACLIEADKAHGGLSGSNYVFTCDDTAACKVRAERLAFIVICETPGCPLRGDIVNEILDVPESDRAGFAESFGHQPTPADRCRDCNNLGILAEPRAYSEGLPPRVALPYRCPYNDCVAPTKPTGSVFCESGEYGLNGRDEYEAEGDAIVYTCDSGHSFALDPPNVPMGEEP